MKRDYLFPLSSAAEFSMLLPSSVFVPVASSLFALNQSLTGLRTEGAAGPEQLWSWWQGSGPAAGPAGCRPHQEPGPSPAPLLPPCSLSLSSAEGGKWFLSSLNVPAGLVALPRLCAVWVRPQLLDMWAYCPGPLGCDLCWLLKVAWHHHLATAFASSASHTASWGLDGAAPDCTPQPYLNGDHYRELTEDCHISQWGWISGRAICLWTKTILITTNQTPWQPWWFLWSLVWSWSEWGRSGHRWL